MFIKTKAVRTSNKPYFHLLVIKISLKTHRTRSLNRVVITEIDDVYKMDDRGAIKSSGYSRIANRK